jgi:hypothetical protein
VGYSPVGTVPGQSLVETWCKLVRGGALDVLSWGQVENVVEDEAVADTKLMLIYPARGSIPLPYASNSETDMGGHRSP